VRKDLTMRVSIATNKIMVETSFQTIREGKVLTEYEEHTFNSMDKALAFVREFLVI
jgi:hypothetical protein